MVKVKDRVEDDVRHMVGTADLITKDGNVLVSYTVPGQDTSFALEYPADVVHTVWGSTEEDKKNA